jgi:hypothetical protein
MIMVAGGRRTHARRSGKFQADRGVSPRSDTDQEVKSENAGKRDQKTERSRGRRMEDGIMDFMSWFCFRDSAFASAFSTSDIYGLAVH